MFNGEGLTSTGVTARIQQKLTDLRRALEAAQDIYAWSSGITSSDLVGIGFSAADAQSLLNAIADANSLATIYKGGTFSGTLPYDFAATQATIIGPQ